jgi:hypothetical protein
MEMTEAHIDQRTKSRPAWLRARWTCDRLAEFEKAAAEEGRKAPEVLRELAAGFLRERKQQNNT